MTSADPILSSWRPWLNLKPSAGSHFTALSAALFAGQGLPFGQGPSMLPYSKTRAALTAACEAEDATFADCWTAAAPDSLSVLDAGCGPLSSPEAAVFRLRCCLYMGLYNEAQRQLVSARSAYRGPELSDWFDLFDLQIGFARSRNSEIWTDSEKWLSRLSRLQSSLNMEGALLHLSSLAIFCKDRDRVGKSFLQTGEIVEQLLARSMQRSCELIAAARFFRHRAAWRFRQNALSLGVDDINLALNLLDVDAPPFAHPSMLLARGEGGRFWRHEAARRIGHFAAFSLLRADELKLGESFSALSLRLDPDCPQALMLNGIFCARHGDAETATRRFRRAHLTGPVERLALGACEAESYLDGEAVELRHLFVPPHRVGHVSRTKPQAPLLPFTVSVVDRLVEEAERERADTRQAIERSETYRRLRQYWRINDDHALPDGAPTFSCAPVVAYRVLKDGGSPSFETLYPQHCFRHGLRSQLIFAAMDTLHLVDATACPGGSLADFLSENGEIREMLAEAEAASPLRLAALIRLLIYLGFVTDAIMLHERYARPGVVEPDEAYLNYTGLFAKSLGPSRIDIDRSCERLWNETSVIPPNYRVLLSICILAGVNAARFEKNAHRVRKWTERSGHVLERIQRCNSFSQFEKALLHSRRLRFAAFEPFLAGRKDDAMRVIQRLTEVSQEVEPVGEHEHLLFRDNSYAVSETVARTELWAEGPDRALNTIAEAAATCDRNDPRLALQVGEYLQKCGRDNEALHQYIKAGKLGPPYRMISYFKAGQLLEKEEEYGRAIAFYLHSLRSYPLGLTPVVQIARIASVTGDGLLLGWASARMEGLSERRDTTATNREIITDLLDRLRHCEGAADDTV